jgi:hypothetical protein
MSSSCPHSCLANSTLSTHNSALGSDGGEGGIRTHGPIAGTHAFQACRFDHSRTSPHRFSRGGILTRGLATGKVSTGALFHDIDPLYQNLLSLYISPRLLTTPTQSLPRYGKIAPTQPISHRVKSYKIIPVICPASIGTATFFDEIGLLRSMASPLLTSNRHYSETNDCIDRVNIYRSDSTCGIGNRCVIKSGVYI